MVVVGGWNYNTTDQRVRRQIHVFVPSNVVGAIDCVELNGGKKKNILVHKVLATQNFDYFVGVCGFGTMASGAKRSDKTKSRMAKISCCPFGKDTTRPKLLYKPG